MDELNKIPFLKFPYKENDLSITEKIILGTIIAYANMDNFQNKCWATNTTIANRLNLHYKTITNNINNLIDKGYIIKENNLKNKKRRLSLTNKLDKNFYFIKIYDPVLRDEILNTEDKIFISVFLNFAKKENKIIFYDGLNKTFEEILNLSKTSIIRIKNKLINMNLFYKTSINNKNVLAINYSYFKEISNNTVHASNDKNNLDIFATTFANHFNSQLLKILELIENPELITQEKINEIKNNLNSPFNIKNS